MPDDLSDYRKEIDRLDDEILRLLNERSKSVVEIGKLKKQRDAGANLHTPAREAAIIERLVQQNTGPFPSDAIRPVYREIMSASLSLEGPQKVAYLGPRATFTHMACSRNSVRRRSTSRLTASKTSLVRWSGAARTSVWCLSRIRLKVW